MRSILRNALPAAVLLAFSGTLYVTPGQAETQTAQANRREAPPPQLLEERTGSPEHEGHQAPPEMDGAVRRVEHDRSAYRGDPVYPDEPYDAEAQLEIYGGKRAVEAPRPLIELGFPQYREGPFGAGHNLVGAKNLVRPQFLVYGDWRTAVAFNDNGETETGLVATRLNLDADLKLTATERIHAFFRPVDRGGKFSRYEFAGDDRDQGDLILDANVENFFFEGDIGAIHSGIADRFVDYDLPFTFGLIPMFFQNGIWVDDAFVGGAFALTARNSRQLDISNYDLTFFAGFDKVSNAGLKDPGAATLADHAGNIYGVAAFADMREGHLEAGWGFVEDTRDDPQGDFSHHSLMAGWTKRYGGKLSNSTRVVWTVGQDPSGNQAQTADGVALLLENSLVTSLPSTLVPYFNGFIGLDQPQPLARGGDGLLKNTGINFETDALTGFPKLDDTARDAWGGALGVSYLFDLSRQIVAEVATVQPMSSSANAPGDQYALGLRYQMNLFGRDRWLLRTDAMYGILDNTENIAGARVEIRRKF
jgi:hypothetical protein